MRCSSLWRSVAETQVKEGFKMSRLSNGLRVISSNDGSGASGIGVFTLNAAKFEGPSTYGAASILEALPLRGNSLHTKEEISRSIGCMGNAFKVMNNKEGMGVMLMTPRYHAREGLRLLNGMCLHPTQDKELFEMTKDQLKGVALTDRDGTRICFELIHNAAWGGAGLGNNLLATPEQLDGLTFENFHEFHAVHTTPSRTVVAGTGIADHEEFALMCEEELTFPEARTSSLLNRSSVSVPYCGGSILSHNTKAPESMNKFAEKNLTHMGLMFQGVPIAHPDYYTVSLIQSLLGGGTSFSSGGPGKGMQTKLFREVLFREGWIHGIECISAFYSDGGMVGLYGTAPHQWSLHLLRVMMYQMASIAQRIDETQLAMARNQLCSQLVLLGEGREQLLSDMGFNLLVHNYILTADETLAGASQVTMSDLKRVCGTMVERPVTFVIHGDTNKAPTHDLLVDQLRNAYKKLNVN